MSGDEVSWAAVAMSGLTTLGVLLQMWKVGRQRKWDLKEREEARQKIALELEAAEDRARDERYRHLLSILEQFRMVMDKLVEGLAAAKVAYKEANDVNLKMARLHADLNKVVETVPKVVVVTPHPTASDGGVV